MPEPADATESYRSALALSRVAALNAVAEWWQGLDPNDLDGAFRRTAGTVVQALSVAQARTAGLAPRYLEQYLGASGVADVVRQPLAAAAFAGRTVDGRALTDPLYVGVIEVKRRVALGVPLEEARAAGLSRVGRAVATELADTAREALTGSMLLDPNVDGYRRSVKLPACGRCLQLAGKRYAVEAAFLRHPRCDCINEPALTNDEGPSPRELFDRMSPAEQDAAVGKADAEAIREGADLSGVVNARAKAAGMAARTPADRARRQTPRGGGKPTPLDLRLEADGDADRYRELLDREGYLLTRVPPPVRPAPRPLPPAARPAPAKATPAKASDGKLVDVAVATRPPGTTVMLTPDGKLLALTPDLMLEGDLAGYRNAYKFIAARKAWTLKPAVSLPPNRVALLRPPGALPDVPAPVAARPDRRPMPANVPAKATRRPRPTAKGESDLELAKRTAPPGTVVMRTPDGKLVALTPDVVVDGELAGYRNAYKWIAARKAWTLKPAISLPPNRVALLRPA